MLIAAVQTEDRSKRLKDLLAQEVQDNVAFLVELAEFDRAKAYESAGYASCWDYCRRELGLLECAVAARIGAARLIQRYPECVEYLRDRRLCMTGLVLLKKVITPGNAHSLFEEASGKSRKQIEELVASRMPPAPGPVTMIRRLPPVAPRTTSDVSLTLPLAPAAELPAAVQGSAEPALPSPQVETPAPREAENRYLIRLSVSREFIAMLEKAKVALSHVVPNGDLESVLFRGLDSIVERAAKKRGPAPERTSNAKPSRPAQPGRRTAIPMHVQRAVRERDKNRCASEMPGGGVCGSEHQLEFDHRIPVARGGKSTVENIFLRCKRHNDQAARKVFGEEFMKRKKARRTERPSASAGRGAVAEPKAVPLQNKIRRDLFDVRAETEAGSSKEQESFASDPGSKLQKQSPGRGMT